MKQAAEAVWQPDRSMAEVVARCGVQPESHNLESFSAMLRRLFLVDRGSPLLMDGEEVMPAARVYNRVTDSKHLVLGRLSEYSVAAEVDDESLQLPLMYDVHLPHRRSERPHQEYHLLASPSQVIASIDILN